MVAQMLLNLEKEANVKGVPVGQAHDIDIPPPRPKRKPTNPYPRKTSLALTNPSSIRTKDGNLVASVSSLSLQTEPCLKSKKEDSCSEAINHFQDATSASISAASKTSVTMPSELTEPCTFREFIPPSKKINKHTAHDESSLTMESKQNDASVVQQEDSTNKGKLLETLEPSSLNEPHATNCYPRHVPVQIVDGNTEACMQTPAKDFSIPASIIHSSVVHGNLNCFSNPSISAAVSQQFSSASPCSHQAFPVVHPIFNPFSHIPDAYRSFLNTPAALSDLIISMLLQNPAAYAAARLAASCWPCMDDSSADSFEGEFPARQANQSPSPAVIAAATLAAASAWWASHGLLPIHPLFNPGFTFPPTTITIPMMSTEAPEVTKTKAEDAPETSAWPDLQLNPEQSTVVEVQSLAPKSPVLSSSSSSESEQGKGVKSSNVNREASIHEEKPVARTGINDPNKGKTIKQLDRSSCGSNTSSGSEVETDMLDKHIKSEEASKEAHPSHSVTESINRRGRSNGNINDSRKEVSEEVGRLAFQALFSREVLPQSFLRGNLESKTNQTFTTEEGQQNELRENEAERPLMLELNSEAWLKSLDQPQCVEMEASLRSDENLEGITSNLLLGHGKMKVCRTGFKPYKRCSMEAKENGVVSSSDQTKENGAKRIRLEAKASI
ncbi:CCA tRNA nucleotidyltransferase, mitochondrial [Asimina triloba]